MKSSNRSRNFTILAVCCLLIAAALVWHVVSPGLLNAENLAQAKRVQQSWGLLQDVGKYDFSTTIQQTTFPAPALANVGKSSTSESYQITGQADLHRDTVNIRVFQNQGSLLNQADGVEIRVLEGKASGRLIGSDQWEPLDETVAASYTFGNNGSSFLTAAKNVRLVANKTAQIPNASGGMNTIQVTAYQFDVDSEQYAAEMRDQMVRLLQQSGKLPIGMNLSLSEQYRQMVASGEVWLNADGLPVRLQVTMKLPPTKNGDTTEAVITTDYFNHHSSDLRAAAFPWNIAGALGLPTSGGAAIELLSQISLLAACAALMVLIVVFSQKKVVYGAIAVLTILSMLVSPLWQSAKAADFTASMAARNASDPSAAAEEPAAFGAWDPHTSPLEKANLASVESQGWSAVSSILNGAYVTVNKESRPASQQVNETGESDIDSDQDGLTDAFERRHDITVLNPNKADTDDDGLPDNVELLLNLFPGQRDTDGDGIWDYDEVRSFYYGDKDWYLNPEENDTDQDGLLDGMECPQRRDGNSSGICQDTDGDLIPDAFDPDDDNDGVPTIIDESPYSFDGQVYSHQSPLKLSLTNLENQPVFIQYQFVPTNKQHLTYAMNVLDWPSGDKDGQIQRVSDTTFADQLTPEQAAKDPRAGFGDMRLIPMLEIKLSGDSYPLPLSRKLSVDVTAGDYSGSLEFRSSEDSPGKTMIQLTQGEISSQTLHLGQGDCDEFAPVTSLNLHAIGDTVTVEKSLGNLVDGDYVLYLTESGSSTPLACSPIPATAHGKLSEFVIDTTLLQAYGAAARNDVDGSVLIYAPLSLLYDQTGGMPVAFSSKVPFTNLQGGFEQSQQEVRFIWLLNMLVDECKALEPGYDESKSGPWCDAALPERWNQDISRIVHSYTEEFHLAGLSVVEDHGVKMAVIFENPAADPEPDFDDPLWGMASGLERSFLAGRSSGGARDITVDEIERRFEPTKNEGATQEARWGNARDAFRVLRYDYDYMDGVAAFMGGQVTQLFADFFNTIAEDQRPERANLLFAREITLRAVSVGEPSASCAGGVCTFDFGSLDTYTQAMINWAPYVRSGDEWRQHDINEYLDLLEARLRSLEAYQPLDSSADARHYAEGQIAMAKMYYRSIFSGIVELVAINDTPTINTPVIYNDEQIFDSFFRNNSRGQGVGKIISTVISTMVDGFLNNPALYAHLFCCSKTDAARALVMALGQGFEAKLSPITNWLTTTLRKVIVGAVATTLIVGLAVMAILYLNGDNSPAGRWGERILFAAIGALSVVLGGVALSSAIKAVKAVSDSAKSAAVIGAVIGGLIAWGMFIYSWASSGASIFSIQFNNMLADAIAATATIVLMAALSCTGVGAIVVAVIGLIDGLISLICALAGAHEQEQDHWARQYVCIGITGWVTKIFKWVLYSNTYLIDYDNNKRLSFNGVKQDLENVSAGMSYGNNMQITITVQNTITKSSVPFDWKAAAYFWQYSDSNAKSATFAYSLQPDEKDIHSGLSRGDDRSGWKSVGDSKWMQEYTAKTDGYTIPLPQPGINQDPVVTISEGSAVPVQECWAIHVPFFSILVPICYIRTAKDTVNSEISSSLTVDVFPATLDEFYTLTADSGKPGAFKLAWGQSGSITFPALRDADGDGLISQAFPGGNDPDDSRYDTDGDGLSDFFELANGTNPRLIDSDDDGLDDRAEILALTSPTRKDTDGDGLTDAEEIAGWLYTYDFTAQGVPLETMVYPDPLSPDADQDGVTDYLEKVYGFNPRVAQDASVLSYELTMRELDSPLMMLRFNESSGAMVFEDSSNFGFTAACTAEECPISGVDGRYAAAVRFGGSDLLRVPTSAKSISLTDNRPFTVAGWVNTETGGTLLSKWSETAGEQPELRVEITSSGQIRVISPAGTATSSASVPFGRWAFIAAVFDGSRVSFSIEGHAAGSASFSTPAKAQGSTPVEMMLGAYQGSAGPTGFYQGSMDEITLFDHALPLEDLAERWMTARYNFNDTYVRPGEKVIYQSRITNQLNSRFAYGLLTTIIDKTSAIVDWASKLLPTTFVLKPDNPVVTGVNTALIETPLQIEPSHSVSEDVTFTQTAAAQIVDRRSESNLAELWLPLDEASGTTFSDLSGNMPPRDIICAENCPASGETGIMNKAVLFRANQVDRLNLPDLRTLNLLNRGFTFSMWVKPMATSTSGATIPLLQSDSNRLAINLVRKSDGTFLPQVLVNGENKVSNSTWRTMKPSLWSHLVVEYFASDGTLKVYINGGQIASATASPLTVDPDDTNVNLWLGGATSPTNFYLDDLRIFSRPLTVIDINRLAERPVLQLKMDSTSFGDSSTYNQPVNKLNTPSLNSQSVRGSALKPGSGSSLGYLQVEGNSLLDMSDGSFTISTWVYPQKQDHPAWQGIFGSRDNARYAYPTLERQGSKLRFGFGNGSTYLSHETGNILPQDRWSLVTITFSPSLTDADQYIFKLYIDHVLKESRIFNGKPTTVTGFYVGTSSRSFTTTLYRLNMDNEHDAGSHAEPYIEEYINGSYTHDPMEETSMGDGDHKDINYSKTLYGFDTIKFTVWEEDSTSGDDDCGSFTRHWYDLPDTGIQTLDLSNGFDGSLTYQMTRPSIQFFGLIDEMEIYRYAIDSEQVYEQYYAIPVTARLPLDDRPSSTAFENTALIGTLDDGICSGENCPAAGAIGLINQAVRFDGMDDVITVPVSTTSSYMVSMWVNSTCTDCGLYTLSNAASVYHQLYLKNGSVCSLAGSQEMCSPSSTVTDGQWHHVVYANNGSSAELWLDGSKVNTLTNSGAVQSPGSTVRLGYAPGAQNQHLNGQLDDVRVFRYAQDAAAIAALQQRAPVFLGHLDEPDGSDIFNDATPNDFQLGCAGESCPNGGSAGRLRQSVEFNQTGDLLTLVQPALSSSAGAFSASLWIYPTQVKDSPQSILTINNGSNTQPRYTLSIAPDSLYLTVQGADAPSGALPQSQVQLIKNTWNMLTLVVEPNASGSGETAFLYINGYLDSSWNFTSRGTGLGRLYLGNSAGFASVAGGPYAGKIDEVAIYTYALNEIDVRDIFAYQMGQVEETASLTMTIDADDPTAELVSFNPDFPYLDEKDRVLHVEATDATSGVGMVEMQVEHANAPDVQWVSAPICQDAPGGTAYCPTFIPAYGDGVYRLTFRVVDKVGHQASTPTYTFLVDNTAPRIFTSLQDGMLYKAEAHPTRENTWFLRMEGRVLDETLSQGSPGSGLDLSSVKVSVISENGEIVGAGTQVPTLTPTDNGYSWTLDYLFPESEPTGAFMVKIEAKDHVENLAVKTVSLLLDASAPSARLESNQVQPQDAASLLDANANDGKLLTGGAVSGSVNDLPPDAAPYMTTSGKQAASGVAGVQAAFEPSLGVSYLFNEPYPEGLLTWLPLDYAKPPEDQAGIPDENAPERYFLDISPAQFAGVCSGASCPINGETGHKNGSIYFDGQGKSINLGSKVDLANRAFSVLLWAQRDTPGNSDPFLWQGPFGIASQRFLFGMDYEDRIVCGFGGSDLLTTERYADTGWHAYACTYDPQSGRRVIYRDGQEVASDIAAPVPRMNEDLIIGSAPVGSFHGSLDELMALDRALSGEEIRAAYTGYQAVYHLAVEEKFLTQGHIIGDQSGYFHTATLRTGEGDATNKVTPGAVGRYALRFDGNDVLAVNPAFSLMLDRGEFTQTAWIKPGPAAAGISGIISQFDENPEQRYPSILLTDQYGLAAGFGDFYDWRQFTTADHIVKPDAWNFIAARFDGTTYSLFVNGELVAQTGDLAGKRPYTAAQFNIGESFVGEIDDVKIFTRPLTDLEITALARTGWRDAQLQSASGGDTWSAAVLPGLEGPYRVDVRAYDQFGHFDTSREIDHQWSGVIDTLAPRFTFERTLDPDDPNLAHYTFSVEDYQLDEASIRQNLCDSMNVTREYFNSSWYLSTGMPPNSALYRLSGTCSGDIRSRETTGFYACDKGGNCVMEEFPAYYTNRLYLPVVNGSGSLHGSVPSLTPAMPTPIAPDQVERAMQWMALTDSLAPVADDEAPTVEIWTEELTSEDARSMFHTNLQGWASDNDQISDVRVEVLQNGAVIYTTHAAVYAGRWNAVWVYPPGSVPANGTYTLRVTAVDAAGNQATAEREITARLLP